MPCIHNDNNNNNYRKSDMIYMSSLFQLNITLKCFPNNIEFGQTVSITLNKSCEENHSAIDTVNSTGRVIANNVRHTLHT